MQDNIEDEYIVIECDECSGNGEYDVMQYCYKPMSDCCGGCYETVECENCNGQGVIEQ